MTEYEAPMQLTVLHRGFFFPEYHEKKSIFVGGMLFFNYCPDPGHGFLI